jgi:hypothetical protein
MRNADGERERERKIGRRYERRKKGRNKLRD